MTKEINLVHLPVYIPIDNTNFVDTIVYSPKYEAMCSIGKKPFSGHFEITMDIEEMPGELLEFESFDAWLKEITDLEKYSYTIESLTHAVYNELTIHFDRVMVTCYASTPVHADVICRISDF